ncbi:MAG: SDR family NAD(P)-dependent oxidoreductase [Pseudomonadota bacterium]|nr:SDR family NAD(P)-dependent oxidoreductase [Pseudomonadota bacterium]
MGAKSLRGQVAIVTGASRGIGQTIATELGRHGAVVIVTARGKSEKGSSATLYRTAQMIEAAGGKAFALPADVRHEAQIAGLVERVLDTYGRIDILVNNAGIMVGDVSFVETTPSMWREIIETNLTGVFLCCRAVIPSMLSQDAGVIVNMSSGAAVRTGFLNVPYGVSKAGLDRLTLGLSAEFSNQGIACISLSPPVSATDTVRRIYPDRKVESWAQPPEKTAVALCALLEDDPMRFTGQVVAVSEYLKGRGSLQ